MKAKVTKTDLKKALAAGGWSSQTCLLAQVAKRKGGTGLFWSSPIIHANGEAYGLMQMFDHFAYPKVYGTATESEAIIGLTLLELVLPMEIEF